MKRLFILLLSLLSFSEVQSQNIINTGSGTGQMPADDAEETAAPARVVVNDATSMEIASMHQEGHQIIFDQLPAINSLTVHITDASGNEVISKKISAKKNVIDISRLKQGMHFVTLVSDRSDRRKSFTLSID